MEQKIKKKEGLDYLFGEICSILKKNKIPYLVIGGLAAGVLGKPRFTEDADFLIFIPRSKAKKLLKTLRGQGFNFDRKEAENTIIARGVFRVSLGAYHADFIINTIKIGKAALKRAFDVKLFGKKVKFPSPEDLILFKLIAGRELDIMDAKNIYFRHRDKIDEQYLIKSAQQICDEIEDMGVWKRLQKLLKEKL
ncbi:nucleotidyl transferase AbiEii/AbiGii toxin family protein [bacterium]|nr:hypothetical protein [Candidatus Omnitrophota bacterium]MBU2528501.1 nucleotidyl transferase AbiEii/AbiGii toxin family protein [bacterium]MBU3930791.1 nucleotidyl transferase AbiEii/AbiGii toxin family protein [bacterium]MBU4122424.1 nucleotidyl transferase AbiEii/AbiGii toxin family protein [bacterium]